MDKKNKSPNVPNLRFSSFTDLFRLYTLKDVLQRVSIPVNVEENKLYYQIGIRSHSKGIFHKEAETGKQIGNKRIFWIEPNCMILNIVFAWEQAVAKTSEKEVGMVASHRFPMYKVLNNSLDYIVDFFKTEKGKQLLQMASPGGAGRNKTLNQDFFLNSKIYLPSLNEQLKTSNLIDLIEDRIETQSKIINSIESQIRAINNHIASDSTSSELNIASLFHVKTSNKLVESNTGKFCIVDMGTIDANGNYITGKYTDDETSLIPYGTLVMPKDDIGGGKIICKTMCINSSNKYALSDHVFALKLKNDKYNPVYFSALINSQYNNHKLKKLVTGSAQLGINQENLNRYKLKFSDSLELQHKYSEIIVRLNEELIIEKRLLDLFSSQKKYLLKNMFV